MPTVPVLDRPAPARHGDRDRPWPRHTPPARTDQVADLFTACRLVTSGDACVVASQQSLRSNVASALARRST
jgi:hypothetical protein